MPTPLHVLIIEDSEDDTALLLRELHQAGYNALHERVETPQALKTALDRRAWDIVISDYTLPHLNGLEALDIVRGRGFDIPFIVVSGSIGEDIAVHAMKAGAHDYIMKHNMARLIPAISRELKEAQMRRERRQAQERVGYLAYHDPLTNLPNRVRFTERLEEITRDARRTGTPAVLLLIDLNHFREINDTLGHDNGDALLRQTAERLRTVLRDGDMAARLGGDEFALLLYPGDAGYANASANRIVEGLTAPFHVAGLPLEVGAKIGIAVFPDHGLDGKRLFQHADVALSLAKRGTRSHVIYDAVRDPSNPRRLLLIGDLRNAINQGQLAPHFQPKIRIQNREITGVEALVRWTHPQRGAIPPDEFIPLAEKTGLINPLTLHMIEAAMEESCRWRTLGLNIPVAVNLSVKDLLDQSLIDKVQALLVGRAMEPGMLELEITETTLMEDPVRALEILSALNDMGIRIYIDDFGTGYSSLAYLRKLPVSAVKIDRSFVNDLTASSDSATIVRSTIDLAHSLGLNVIAEGVENEVTWDRLAEYGCDEAQGYFIARPMPGDELQEWICANPMNIR